MKTYVALSDQKLVGTVSIWRNDLRCRQDLYPWMTNLYVIEDMKNEGVDTLLQSRIMDEVRQLGYKELFLISTNDYEYYEKLGWKFKELAPKMNGEMTRIYYKDLSVSSTS